MTQRYRNAKEMDTKNHDILYDELERLKEENFNLKKQLEIESKRFEELKNQGIWAKMVNEKIVKVNRADYELNAQSKIIGELRATLNRTLKSNKEKDKTISMLTRYIKKLEHDVTV